MYYEVVDLSSGNRIGEFDTEDEALRDLWVYCRRGGQHSLWGIALTEEDETTGKGKIVAEGDDLAQLVLRSIATPV